MAELLQISEKYLTTHIIYIAMSVSIQIHEEVYMKLSQVVGDDIQKATEQAILEWIERRNAFSKDTFYTLKPVSLGVKELSSDVDSTLYGEKK